LGTFGGNNLAVEEFQKWMTEQVENNSNLIVPHCCNYNQNIYWYSSVTWIILGYVFKKQNAARIHLVLRLAVSFY